MTSSAEQLSEERKVEPLTYSIVLDEADTGAIGLAPCDVGEISPAMWEQLACDIAAEPTLMPSPASLLSSRWQGGFAAAAIHQGRVISYIALVPIVHRGAGAPSWETLAEGLGTHGAPLPETSIYSFTNSWTARPWRRRGISLALRPPLIGRYLVGGNLGILDMDGLASPVPAQLGWQIVAWDRVPFLSSLVSLPASEFPDRSSQTWTSPLALRRYQGPHVALDDTAHPWKQYVYFWVSNVALAEKLDRQLAALLGGDLHRWRSAIAAVYPALEMLWKVPFDIE